MKDTSAGAGATTGDVHKEFEIAKEAVLEAYANFLEAKRHLKKAALAAGIEFRESANEQLEEALGRARDKKDAIRDKTGDYIQENPITSASIAFLGGVIFSRMFGK